MVPCSGASSCPCLALTPTCRVCPACAECAVYLLKRRVDLGALDQVAAEVETHVAAQRRIAPEERRCRTGIRSLTAMSAGARAVRSGLTRLIARSPTCLEHGSLIWAASGWRTAVWAGLAVGTGPAAGRNGVSDPFAGRWLGARAGRRCLLRGDPAGAAACGLMGGLLLLTQIAQSAMEWVRTAQSEHCATI